MLARRPTVPDQTAGPAAGPVSARARAGAGRRTDRLLTLIVFGLFTVFPLFPPSGVAVVALLTFCITLFAWLRHLRCTAYAAIFCSLCFVGIAAGVRFSQIWLGLAIAVHAAVVKRTPWIGELGWNRRGSLGREVLSLCLAAAVVAAVALLTWFALLQPDVDDIVQTFFPDVALPLLVLGGLLFSMVNAAVEEIAYRGIFLHALDQTLGRGAASVGLQALAFGTLHIHGFPRGWIGVGLATIYGLMIGIVRVRAGGMFAPWLAHVLTDMAIVGILVLLVLD